MEDLNEKQVEDAKIYKQLATISKWTLLRYRLKKFILQKIKLSERQQKIYREVHDFWHQQIVWDHGFHLRPAVHNDIDELEYKAYIEETKEENKIEEIANDKIEQSSKKEYRDIPSVYFFE